jgi:alkyldihydroxyacetonephosphate synthase
VSDVTSAEPALTARLADSISRIVGPENLLSGAAVEEFCWDALGPWRGFPEYGALSPQPLVVARPGTTEEVSAIVQAAAEAGVSIVPYGGGSGLMGGAVALRPSVVIDLKRMDSIIDIDGENRTVRVESGVILETLEFALNREGLILGHDPWSLPIATVGGAISTDSLGYRGAKYGSIGNQVLGLTAVLPDGRVFSRAAPAKASVGPDLRRLFVGSEGCFGIVTDATLRAFPQPELRSMRAYRFQRFQDGFAAIVEMHGIGLAPALLDYGEHPGESWGAAPATLYLGFEGFREEVGAQKRRARQICTKAGARSIGRGEARAFWKGRHDVALSFAERRRRGGMRSSPAGGAFDFVHVTLPRSRVLDYRAASKELLERHAVRVVEYGIWCWPELFSVYVTAEGADARERLCGAVDELLSLTREMGGSIEYCHGVGVRLAHLMEREHGGGLEIMRSIKRTLDPQGILNPGKLGL